MRRLGPRRSSPAQRGRIAPRRRGVAMRKRPGFRAAKSFDSSVVSGGITPYASCSGYRSKRIMRDEKRSEEHTSELQSLMRISYAVFCLKKKKNTHNQDN